MTSRFAFPMLTLSACMLAACGGGGSGGGNDVAAGGIGGTSAGTVTGFNGISAAGLTTRAAAPTSLEINDTRVYTFKSGTEVTVDDDTAKPEDIQEGMVVEVELDDDVNADFTTGTLEKVHVESAVKGPVTGISPLTVLGQPIVTDSTTVLPASFDVSTLQVGDIVEVHGQRDTDAATGDSLIRASFLKKKDANTPRWTLTGPISGLDPNTSFTIGSQTVLISGVEVKGCPGGLANGTQVRVRATADAGFSGNNTLDTVSFISCKRGAHVPDDFSGNTLKTSYEGVIDSVTSATQFTVNGQAVTVSANTDFERGTAADIVVGARVEAEGTLNVDTGELVAAELKFRESRFRIEGPLTPADVSAGTMTLFGVNIKEFARTRDESNIFDGIASNTQVSVEGFVNASGTAFARRVEVKSPAISNYEIRGPIASLNAPALTFTVLGVTVDTANSVFSGETHHGGRTRKDGPESSDSQDDSGSDDVTITSSADFFAAAKVGQQVKVKGGTYSATPPTISNADIELDD